MKEEEEELRRSNLSKPFHDGVGPRPGPDPAPGQTPIRYMWPLSTENRIGNNSLHKREFIIS